MIPPNFGGHMRAIMFWDLLATQDRDWWGLFMSKFGMPIGVGKVNTQQADSVERMQQALAMCQQLGGIVIDSKATMEWAAMATQDGANAHKIFFQNCNDEISKIVIGQSMSANPKNTGMGSGVAGQAEEVREDIRQQDTMKLSDTLEKQLFRWYLDLNGYKGHAPKIMWGGMREGAFATFTKSLGQAKLAGLRPTKVGLKSINERGGVEFEIDPMADQAGGMAPNPQDKENNSRTKY